MSSRPVSTPIAGVGEGRQSVVYVIDDDESMRIAMTNLLASFGLHVETFASPREFLAFPRTDIPSCLILDVRLRGESGLAFQQESLKSDLRMPVLFMTGYGDVSMSVRAMKAGALDFFTKPFRDQDMLDAVVHALARDHERLVAEQSLVALRSAYESLSLREREVMSYVITGLLNKQIASAMNIREVTVKIHRGQVMKKMAARSIAGLVRMAAALGVEPAA
ncbi:two component transcriptional regulator, LuxR family [Burkholderia sp. H160]|nr:two component transcriptional regulator, LuxR family [Burkholderia sp. H160]